jgi:hypothetical protein
MQKLFSNQAKQLLSPVVKSEQDLQQFICDNWKGLFPEYTFITQEFKLKGAVHGASSGRIDILAYNPATKRFVFFELKKNYAKNVGHQAANYRHFIHTNFSEVYVDALQKHKATLPDKEFVNAKEVETVLIAGEFVPNQISQAETESLVTLIEYNWFDNDLVLFDYVHNAPDYEDTSDSDKIKEPYKGKDWHYIVGTIQKANVREGLQALQFPPDTKKQYDALIALVGQVPNVHKRTALQKRLEALEFGAAPD